MSELENYLLELEFLEITNSEQGARVLSGFDTLVQNEIPIYTWFEPLQLCFVLETQTGRVWVRSRPLVHYARAFRDASDFFLRASIKEVRSRRKRPDT